MNKIEKKDKKLHYKFIEEVADGIFDMEFLFFQIKMQFDNILFRKKAQNFLTKFNNKNNDWLQCKCQEERMKNNHSWFSLKRLPGFENGLHHSIDFVKIYNTPLAVSLLLFVHLISVSIARVVRAPIKYSAHLFNFNLLFSSLVS